jgi:hypothetical protein
MSHFYVSFTLILGLADDFVILVHGTRGDAETSPF